MENLKKSNSCKTRKQEKWYLKWTLRNMSHKAVGNDLVAVL